MRRQACSVVYIKVVATNWRLSANNSLSGELPAQQPFITLIMCTAACVQTIYEMDESLHVGQLQMMEQSFSTRYRNDIISVTLKRQ